MDLNTALQGALSLALTIGTPIAMILAKRAIALAETRLHLTVSAANETKILQAVNVGAGMITAKLAAGQMTLPDVHMGNEHVASAVTMALDIAGAAGVQAGLTRDVLAAQIVGAVGHALGEDPTVPTVPAPVKVTA